MDKNRQQKSEPAHAAYHSFLVRLWRDEENGVWRATVRTVATGEQRHFTDLESLFAFLQHHTISHHTFQGG